MCSNFICNKGSSLLLRSSIIIAGDELFISHGKAEKGAAIKVLDGSLVCYLISTQFFTFYLLWNIGRSPVDCCS